MYELNTVFSYFSEFKTVTEMNELDYENMFFSPDHNFLEYG